MERRFCVGGQITQSIHFSGRGTALCLIVQDRGAFPVFCLTCSLVWESIRLEHETEVLLRWRLITWTPDDGDRVDIRNIGHQLHGLSPKKTAVYIKTPWPEPASELYRPSDRRLSNLEVILRKLNNNGN
jgi:hypothetical protein